LDITFHGLWIFYRESDKITAYAFTDPANEHCYAVGWFANNKPVVKCLPNGLIPFNNLKPLDPGAEFQTFDDRINICVYTPADPVDLLKGARVAISLPHWPGAITSLRIAIMQDVGNYRHPGALVQRLTYSFSDTDPSLGVSPSLVWSPTWSAGKANIHLFAEPDKDVGDDHAVTALNDVVQRVLQLGDGLAFTQVYQKAPPSNPTAQDQSLAEMKVKCPCGAIKGIHNSHTPANVANCMGIIVP
jgi:hypothetical protein